MTWQIADRHLRDFTVSVGDVFDAATFDPVTDFTNVCTHYCGPIAWTRRELLICEDAVIGRYLSVHVHQSSGRLLMCSVEVYEKSGKLISDKWLMDSNDTNSMHAAISNVLMFIYREFIEINKQ